MLVSILKLNYVYLQESATSKVQVGENLQFLANSPICRFSSPCVGLNLDDLLGILGGVKLVSRGVSR